MDVGGFINLMVLSDYDFDMDMLDEDSILFLLFKDLCKCCFLWYYELYFVVV